MTVIRVGEIVKGNKNPVLNVSPEWESLVNLLSKKKYDSKDKELLAVLAISQTEMQYKKFMIKALVVLDRIDSSMDGLIADWNEDDLEIRDEDFKHLFSKEEFSLIKKVGFEDHMEKHEDEFPDLFQDNLLLSFYPSKKKGMLIWRRLTIPFIESYDSLSTFQKVILHFITAQLLISWESSCIHMGKMLVEDWGIEEIAEWFNKVWPIYTK